MLRFAPMLLAASSVAPTSIYLSFRDLNPSLATTIVLLVCSFAFLTIVVATLRVWWQSDLLVVVICLVWIALTTSGGILNRSNSESLRIGTLFAIFLLIGLLARIFRWQIVEWFKLASLLSLAATTLQIALVSFVRPPNYNHFAQPQATTRASAGNFYMIVLDGYGLPEPEEMETLDFFAELRKSGFTVVTDAVSNYTATYSSMSSMLSLDHRFSKGLVHLRDMFSAMQGANQMRTLLEGAGLSYVHIESDWPGTRCGPTVSTCVSNAFPDGLAWEVGQLSYFGPYIRNSVTSPHVAQGLRSLQSIKARSLRRDSKPEFVFAHILLPHPPFQLQANCEVAIDEAVLGEFFGVVPPESEGAVYRSQRYIEQRDCLNAELLLLIESLPEKSSVLITSDHGPDLRGQLDKPRSTWDSLDIRERFRIFHAVRLPKRCDLSVEHDLVNLVRSEIGCLVGASIQPVPPHFEISPPPFLDETARVLGVHEVLNATK